MNLTQLFFQFQFMQLRKKCITASGRNCSWCHRCKMFAFLNRIKVSWRVLALGKPSLMIEGKAGAYQCGAPFNSLKAGSRPHPYMQGKLEKCWRVQTHQLTELQRRWRTKNKVDTIFEQTLWNVFWETARAQTHRDFLKAGNEMDLKFEHFRK